MASGGAERGRFENELELESSYGFYFPTAIGYALLLRYALEQGEISAVTFDQARTSLLNQKSVIISAQAEEVLKVVRQKIVTHSYLIRWADQGNQIWLDDYQWPLKIDFGNGQVANETQYIRYY
jgi:hypothetical protein